MTPTSQGQEPPANPGLFGVTAHDPATLALAALGIAAVASAAGYIPAMRASRVDAMEALRYE